MKIQRYLNEMHRLVITCEDAADFRRRTREVVRRYREKDARFDIDDGYVDGVRRLTDVRTSPCAETVVNGSCFRENARTVIARIRLEVVPFMHRPWRGDDTGLGGLGGAASRKTALKANADLKRGRGG